MDFWEFYTLISVCGGSLLFFFFHAENKLLRQSLGVTGHIVNFVFREKVLSHVNSGIKLYEQAITNG